MKIASVRAVGVSLPRVPPKTPPRRPSWATYVPRGLPMSKYPEFSRLPGQSPGIGGGSVWVQVTAEDGTWGLGRCSFGEPVAALVDGHFAPLLQGRDCFAHEYLNDLMWRASLRHGARGLNAVAQSGVDLALWDLKGKLLGQPVYRLLGGPTRTAVPAYASALGYSLEPARVAERARAMVAEGYTATKWFFRHGPGDGRAGMDKNEELVATLREAVGPDVEIMLDAWMSWDVPYTLEMARRLERYRPYWIEEPVLPDKIESYAAIRRQSPVRIAGGEHEYTRWGLHQLISAGGVDFVQADIYWAGGITETLKICAVASVYDLPVIPHGHSTPAGIHLIAAQPQPLTPLVEYLIKWNEVHQFFLKRPVKPVNGLVHVPDGPGIGMDLDEAKIEERRELRWTEA